MSGNPEILDLVSKMGGVSVDQQSDGSPAGGRRPGGRRDAARRAAGSATGGSQALTR